jgi:ribosomal protein S6--L-glutamate ligase
MGCLASSSPVRILILSRSATLYSTTRLVLAARARGHEVDVADALQFYLCVKRGRPEIYYRGEEPPRYDIIIPRIGASITSYGLAVVRHFEMMGVPTLNGAVAIARSRDKLRAMQLLTKRDIDVPITVCARTPKDLDLMLELVGGTPVIVKLQQGTQGIGVMIAETRQAVSSLLETLWGMGQEIVVQQYIAEAKGRDVRAFVVGGRVVAAMRRSAKAGEFRSNLHRGGAGNRIQLSEEYMRAAVAATKVMGLEVAGVDMLESSQGPKILEINSSPGLEGIERATNIDVADKIILRAERYVERRRKKRSGDAVIEAERRARRIA